MHKYAYVDVHMSTKTVNIFPELTFLLTILPEGHSMPLVINVPPSLQVLPYIPMHSTIF